MADSVVGFVYLDSLASVSGNGMKNIVIDDYGEIMDEGCSSCERCKVTGYGWACVFAENDDGELLGTGGCKQAYEKYDKIKNAEVKRCL